MIPPLKSVAQQYSPQNSKKHNFFLIRVNIAKTACPFCFSIPALYLCMINTIALGEAIKQMKLLSEKNIPFSFSYTSYNQPKNTSEGVIKVHKALIRKQDASHLLQYFDTMQQLPKCCHIPLLMTFNGHQIKI